MIATIKYVFKFLKSPRLYSIHGNETNNSVVYSAGPLERWPDSVVYSIYVAYNIGIYLTPLISGYLIYKGNVNLEFVNQLWKYGASIGVLLATSLLLRSCGRALNPQYTKFYAVLEKAQEDPAHLVHLQKYDCDFTAWPVSFSKSSFKNTSIFGQKWERTQPKTPQNLARLLLGETIMRLFAVKLIYPGSISVLQIAIASALNEGREKLYYLGGERHKLRTSYNTFVEVMYIDKRNKTPNGHTLVVCCEGNAGFYEVGIMTTPLVKGYSCLGWNHPGFGGSTGIPLPEQEQEFMDTIMQYAINELGFSHENIIIFGWSIGGYPSTWAAANYPNIKALILDATFDSLLPLAKSHMPDIIESIVVEVVERHANLNISEQLLQYNGPVLLYRRTQDEVICTTPGDLSTNRANNLLIDLIKSRHGKSLTAAQINVLKQYLSLHGQQQIAFINNCQDMENKKFLILAAKYLIDFNSTHCTPLPPNLFQLPWHGEVNS